MLQNLKGMRNGIIIEKIKYNIISFHYLSHRKETIFVK
jgi:hypothetical protein